MRIYADDGRRPEKMLHVEQQEQLGVNHRRQGGSNSRRPSTVVHRSRLTTAPPPSTTAPGTSIRLLNLRGSIRPALPHRRPRTRTTETPRQPPGVTGGKVGPSPSLAPVDLGRHFHFLFVRASRHFHFDYSVIDNFFVFLQVPSITSST
jgi:hypothetical protein